MIVVADTSPVRYLLQIEAIYVLEPLYQQVLIPETVAGELREPAAPDDVRAWLADLPAWFEIRPDPSFDPGLRTLDPGERSAIALAESLKPRRLLIDEWAGRAEAQRRHLRVTGTLGILAEAHQHQLIDFEESLARLRRTNFTFLRNWSIIFVGG